MSASDEATELRIAIARVLERWQGELIANMKRCAELEQRMRGPAPADRLEAFLVMFEKREAFARTHVLAEHVLDLRFVITPSAKPPDPRQPPLPFEQRPMPASDAESSMLVIMARRN